MLIFQKKNIFKRTFIVGIGLRRLKRDTQSVKRQKSRLSKGPVFVSHGGPLAKKLVIPGQFPETSVCKLSLAPFQFSVLISFFMSKSLNKSESNKIIKY